MRSGGHRTGKSLRRGLASVLASITLLASQAGEDRSIAGPPEERPNVLLIVTDDQRQRGTLRVMPAVRRLFAKHGKTFDNAIATTPLCCPSRVSILTGQYAHNHGIKRNFEGREFRPGASMLGELRSVGYLTAISGKFLNGWGEWRAAPFDQYATTPLRYEDVKFNVNGKRVLADYSTRFIGRKAIDFLEVFEEKDETPWFMQISPIAPHIPAEPERRYADAPIPRWHSSPASRETDLSDKPPYVRNSRVEAWRVRDVRARQLRTLMSVDDMVADVFARMRDLEEGENTIAIFMSDNGWMWYEHRLHDKRYPYEDSVRIPLLMRWPGYIGEGTTSKKIVANIDIAPTIYQAAGITPSYAVDGQSFFGSDRQHILLEHWPEDTEEVPRWSGLWTPQSTYAKYEGRQGFREFYRDRDPWQLRNVYRDGVAGNEPTTKPLDQLLRAYGSCAGATCP
jgi:arylsulfatase A-like enzyme